MSSNPTIIRPSLKPRQGRSFKRLRRIEIVARLEAAFISDQDIAQHLGLTVPAIYAIKATPEFLAKRITLSTGILSKYDQHLAITEEDKKSEINELNTLALNSVKSILLDRTNTHHAKVALDMLDRSKATSKISRTEHSVSPILDSSVQDIRARELLALIGGPVAQQEPKDCALPEPEPIPMIEEPIIEEEPEEEIGEEVIKPIEVIN